MDLFYLKVAVCIVALILLIAGFRATLRLIVKERCIRCYVSLRRKYLTKAPGFRGDFWVCKPCGEIIESYKDQQ